MEKLKMHSLDKLKENITKIGELFPNCLTERMNENGEVERAIDFDMLRQELSKDIVEGNEERYQFTWPDKKQAMRLANLPINKTLRPCREESVDFDTTQNLYIEGDNLEVLKLLQETYLGKIKMIYIDPPYNTGNDFVYEDDFSQSAEEYFANSGQQDEEGNRLVQNTESNGRFHTDWLNMMYPRLKLAKDLLSDDGVIFISIDDNESDNLKKICDEIFGVNNFVAVAPRKTGAGSAATNSDSELRKLNDFVLIYLKTRQAKFKKKVIGVKEYPYSDDLGSYTLGKLQASGSDATRRARPKMYYPIYLTEDGMLTTKEDAKGIIKTFLPQIVNDEDGRWIWQADTFEQKQKDYIKVVDETIYRKIYRDDNEDQTKYQVEKAWFDEFTNAQGTKEFDELFGRKKIFSHPKPIGFVEKLVEFVPLDKEFIVIDFFSGSSTTAHAVLSLNAKDGGKRRFIMVQVPEVVGEAEPAFKAGYKNICEIGKERIRRAGTKIKADNPLTTQDLDIGFRVLKCDSSNMKDVYYTPAEYNSDLFEALEDNIKEGRTAEDLLFQVMLDLGVLLSSKIESLEIGGKQVFNVENGYLLACFENNLTDDVITEIAKMQPYYFVMRDSSMADDSVAANFEQIFNTYSPNTVRRVL